jgi:hypothetical protein
VDWSKVVVMFPDFKGEGCRGVFGKRLLKVCEGATLIPVLNGLPKEQLESIVSEVLPKFKPIVSEAKNLRGALESGYCRVIRNYPECYVVRLDTAEHPPEYIPQLLEVAEQNQGMVIGDLTFDEKTLVPNTMDELVHLDIFPALYGQFSWGKLRISCAHGFQVFAPYKCSRVFAGAERIVGQAERELGSAIGWGFDGAMALSASCSLVPTPVDIVKVPAETVRNRDRKKIAIQFENALRMCLAAVSVAIAENRN